MIYRGQTYRIAAPFEIAISSYVPQPTFPRGISL